MSRIRTTVTENGREWIASHYGDCSGNVVLGYQDHNSGTLEYPKPVTLGEVPYALLEEIVANRWKRLAIKHIEQMSASEWLARRLGQ